MSFFLTYNLDVQIIELLSVKKKSFIPIYLFTWEKFFNLCIYEN